MKKTSKKSKKLTVDNEAEQRGQWVRLLEHTSMFHKQMVKETHNPIIGGKESEDNIFHRAAASAIDDAVLLIEMVEEQGFFNNIPQYNQGPAG